MNFVKDEYLQILENILSPLLFQGFQSIFDTALSYKKKNNLNIDELRIFQDLLRSVVPNWNKNTIEQEVKRIKILCRHSDCLEDLLRIIVKTYIMFLTGKELNSDLELVYKEVDFSTFIHKAYINSSRELFNSPFLFCGSSPREIKDNQKQILKYIKESINNAIKDIIPLNMIIKIALEEEIKVELQNYVVPRKSDIQNRNNDPLVLKPPTLPLYLEHTKNERNNNQEIPLLSTEGGNIMEKVFSNFKIVENKPNLVQDDDVLSIINSEKPKSPTTGIAGHTVSNFLKQDDLPAEASEIKQSMIEDYDGIFDNNN